MHEKTLSPEDYKKLLKILKNERNAGLLTRKLLSGIKLLADDLLQDHKYEQIEGPLATDLVHVAELMSEIHEAVGA